MLFNSIQFLLFFPTVVVLYFLMSARYRWALLLVASYYFYACWKAEYLILIVASTLVDYWAGIKMGDSRDVRQRRRFLAVSLCSNLGLLFAFKYFNFFSDSARALLDRFDVFVDTPAFGLLLPVGISFYTFQTLGYSIDVYRGKKDPERHLGIFALYVAFFPQLVAGPIERSTNLLPQFSRRVRFDFDRIASGLNLMLWGFFKKVVIADRLAPIVNSAYDNPSEYHGVQLLVATYFFAFQIYCDFSGYSDIAIGAARVLGFDLMENFRRPYSSKSIAEFWQRWHISLSSWFRDYLYIPLGGNRVSRGRWYQNLIVVFVLSGLWHGAAWTFVVWGFLHGFYLVFSIVTAKPRAWIWDRITHVVPPANLLRRPLAIFVTFHLVLLSWVFFRAKSLGDAVTILDQIFVADFMSYRLSALTSPYELLVAFGVIAFLESVHALERRDRCTLVLTDRPLWKRWAFTYALILGILVFGDFSTQEFIYFQF